MSRTDILNKDLPFHQLVPLLDTAEAVIVTDGKWRILRVNGAFTRITGYGQAEAGGQVFQRCLAGGQPAPWFADLAAGMAAEGAWSGEVPCRRRDGSPYPGWLAIKAIAAGGDGKAPRYLLIHGDLSRRQSEEQLIRHLADYDPLTGLVNRDRLQAILAGSLAAVGAGLNMALVTVDLDRFRAINEGLGHPIGDYILQAMAERLVRHAGPQALVARCGGDEFCVVCPPSRHALKQAAALAEVLLAAIAEPLCLADQEYVLTASAGISLYPRDADSAANLLDRACTATEYAKRTGRNTFQFFSPAMQAAADERLLLENGLRQAIEHSQLVLHYQPVIDLAYGRIAGVEALVRWRHPELGIVSPLRFIPLAEENGTIATIGEWVLREACRQGRRWHEAGHRHLQMAVNLSPVQFRQPFLPARVAAILAETGFDPACLTLEITEGAIMQEPEQAAAILGQLKRESIQIAVDDFGTGYSSLAYLKRFPIDRLKIDKSFVTDCHWHRYDGAIVDTVIRLGLNLGLKVVAEGVESEAQLNFMRARNCNFAQGYLFSPPLPAEEMETMLTRRWPPPAPLPEDELKEMCR